MSDMRSIPVINFSGRTSDWEGWSKKVLFSKKQEKGYKKLLTGKDEIPTAEKYEKAVPGGMEGPGDIIRFNNLNEEAFEDIILSMYWSHDKTRKSCV